MRRAMTHGLTIPILFTGLLTVGCVAVGVHKSGDAPEAAGASEAGAAPQGASAKDSRRFDEVTAGLEERPGLLNLWIDEARAKVWLELSPSSADGLIGDYLYVEGLVTGLGSNPVGLDRGQLGRTRVVRLRRLGSRLLIEETNWRYRALTDDPAERLAVEESFARSVLWAGDIVGKGADSRGLVDLTEFLIRDAHEVGKTLAEAGQGAFKLDAERSVVDTDACLAFPDNLEMEAVLTYGGEKPGRHVRETAPTPEAVTLVQHHSLIRLPDDGYRPRAFDPRAGSFAIEFFDYAAGLAEPLEKRWIVRHRLATVGDGETAPRGVVEPLVYYVDPAMPEPVREAILEGAGWWTDAFAAAGFEGAFQVAVLPPGVHPLDVRYNVIQWVHRSTRGWSYGGGITDPRTGEMIKGHVSLGSLRVRQDRLLFEGLSGTEKTGTGGADDPVELALARIRQLAAHEVGHTLGLAHNFAASTYGRASVMDYPAPLVELGDGGELDFSRAYGVGVGEWDRHAIRYAYGEVPPGETEASFRERTVRAGLERELIFLSDKDARPPGAAQPLANLWDNGAEPVVELERLLEVRHLALERFGERNVAIGTPLALLEEVLAPLYFQHRFQIEAAAKVVGGLDYRHALRGDGQAPARPLPADRQRAALEALLSTLEPARLDLPDRVLALLLPRPPGYEANRELFDGAARPAFDPLGAADAVARLTVRALLQPQRAARLVDFHRRHADLPGFDEILAALSDAAFAGPPAGERSAAIQRTVESVVVDELIGLASRRDALPAVRALAERQLVELGSDLAAGKGEAMGNAAVAHRQWLAAEIGRFLDRRRSEKGSGTGGFEPPPGDPIGSPSLPRDLAGCSFEPPRSHRLTGRY